VERIVYLKEENYLLGSDVVIH